MTSEKAWDEEKTASVCGRNMVLSKQLEETGIREVFGLVIHPHAKCFYNSFLAGTTVIGNIQAVT